MSMIVLPSPTSNSLTTQQPQRMSFYDFSPHRPTPTHFLPRLLLPTVRNPRSHHYNAPPPPSPTSPYKSPKLRSSSSRSSRTRFASPQLPPDLHSPSVTVGQIWLGKNANFEIVQDQLELGGFQLFAVEKWCVV